MKNLCKQNWYQITLLFLFCVTVFLRFYKLTVLPDVLHIDEAALGYNSWCLANYGTDRYLNVLPFYPQNFYGGQSPLYTYLVVLLIKFFGKGNLSVFLVRFPAAFASLLLWITGTRSMSLIFDNKKITFPRILLWAVSACITALPVILFAYTLLFHAEPIHFLGFTISPISGNRMDEISFSSLGANLWNNLKITLTYSIYPMDSVDKFYTLYPVSIPFILLGMLCSVYDFGNSFRTRCFHSGTVYLFYFISCSFVVALTPTDHLYRANSIYICYLFFFLRGIRACCDFLTVYRKAFLSILAYGYVLWIASFMRYYYTIYSVLDLHTYANSFYFADISDIVTYIDENLGDKEIYADCVDVEEFLYFYYPISPYERVPLSAREEDDEIPKHYILNASTPLSPSAAYIVRKENQEFISYLNDSGLSCHTVEFSPYYLFYFD